MMRLGYVEEAKQFQTWLGSLLNYDSEQGPLQVLYGIDGRHEMPEETLDHLRGYMDSRPVRIGNAAFSQLQLDIYGEMMDAAYLSSKYGEATSHDGWLSMKRMLGVAVEKLEPARRGHLGGSRRPAQLSALTAHVLGSL